MDLEEIRILTIEVVRLFGSYSEDPSDFTEERRVDNVVTKIEQQMHQRMNRSEQKYFLESFQDLVNQGVLVWGKEVGLGSTAHFYPYFSITSYGETVLESDNIIVHDPFHYLERLKQNGPILDGLILMYIEESLQCHFRQNYMASSVMLGVASEAALYHLIRSFQKCIAINATLRERSEKLGNKANLTEKFKVIYDGILQIKKELDPEVADTLEQNLTGIFNLIRLQRNESGHPTGQRPSKDQMFAYLILFILYCKTVYDLIKWLDARRV
jgi:hypothetical protein